MHLLSIHTAYLPECASCNPVYRRKPREGLQLSAYGRFRCYANRKKDAVQAHSAKRTPYRNSYESTITFEQIAVTG